jgi:hypothetical protein
LLSVLYRDWFAMDCYCHLHIIKNLSTTMAIGEYLSN